MTGGARLVDGHAHAAGLRVRVDGTRYRAVVRLDVLAERHAHDHLALVMSQVSVHLRSGRITCDPDAVGQLQRPVAWQAAVVQRHACVLEAQAVDRNGSPDRQHHVLAAHARAIGELDLVVVVV